MCQLSDGTANIRKVTARRNPSEIASCRIPCDARDEKGFAFRYPRHGGERYDYDFSYIRGAMEHIYDVLENMDSYLVET